MWTILDQAGSSNQSERIALMQCYLQLFGPDSIAWLLAEVEFIGGRWIKRSHQALGYRTPTEVFAGGGVVDMMDNTKALPTYSQLTTTAGFHLS